MISSLFYLDDREEIEFDMRNDADTKLDEYFFFFRYVSDTNETGSTGIVCFSVFEIR